MPFWKDAQVADPKRSFRWVLSLGVAGLSDNIQYICKKVNKPKLEVGESEHKFLNHTFYYPGSVTYNICSVTMVDPANPHSTQQLYNLIQDSGYQLPSGITDAVGANTPMASTISKRLGTGAMNSAVILMLDGDGNTIEKTTLENPWIKSVDFGGDLDYETEGLMEITMELRYDWFKLETFTPNE
tara:strand:+ start:763 stop:1317 length:555 start_codon:yes stop_codon:yes gene_type:complete